jgi:hypothetical protein
MRRSGADTARFRFSYCGILLGDIAEFSAELGSECQVRSPDNALRRTPYATDEYLRTSGRTAGNQILDT